MGDVFETTVSGYKLAHKRVVTRRKIGDIEKKEIEILKKVSSNTHMIQLIGTYTHRQFLGLLLHPVAVCDLHTSFADVEDWYLFRDSEVGLDQTQQERLTALGFDFPAETRGFDRASFVYHKIGCLVSAVEYLHDQKIRHKDLKPSNILLSHDHLWLSDFGSATDFSLLSQSATDNERGSPRYFSPEVSFSYVVRMLVRGYSKCHFVIIQVAAWKPNGRASDMFSLGCILLEILVLHDRGTLAHIRQNRSSDPSFHANLDKLDVWCTPSTRKVPMLWSHISQEIKLLLAKDPATRSTARQALIKLTAYDISYSEDTQVSITAKQALIKFTAYNRTYSEDTQVSIFGKCCRGVFSNAQELEERGQKQDSKTTTLQKGAKELNNVTMPFQATHSDFKRSDLEERSLYEFMEAQSGLSVLKNFDTAHENGRS